LSHADGRTTKGKQAERERERERERRTDTTELIVIFRNFVNVPKNDNFEDRIFSETNLCVSISSVFSDRIAASQFHLH